ncbi:MAG: UDP-N-acetylmuramoylalanyl-D-glutamyl-2, 6-diaminopimelate--D-alanyl-D-alanine ligase, partial [Alphaproteobacteria bacterium]
DVARAALRLEGMTPLPGRGARYRLQLESEQGEALLIDESYNSNPLSLVAALEQARACAGNGRLVAVLADMAELGPRGPELHLALADGFRRCRLDLAIALGPQMAAALAAAEVETIEAANIEEARGLLMPRLRAGDTVMIKGANRAGLGALVARLRTIARVPGPSGRTAGSGPAMLERAARLAALG